MAPDIQTLMLEDVHYIGFPATLAQSLIASLDARSEEWAGLNVKFHVLDLAQVAEVPTGFFAAISRFSDRLKGAEGRLISINMRESIANKVKAAGLESVFNRIHNYPKDLYPQNDLAFSEVEEKLRQHLTVAAREIGQSSFQMSFSASAAKSVPWPEISCGAGLTSAAKGGTFSVRLFFSSDVLHKLAVAMMGREIADGDPLIEGAALELLNLIYGRAQSAFNNQYGPMLSAGTPSLEAKTSQNALPALTIATDVGCFYLQIESQSSN